FPDKYKTVFTGPNGVVDQTNALLQGAGVAMRVEFHDYNDPAEGDPKTFGDIRYNFIRWISDMDTQDIFVGVAQWVADPRTGEILSATININDSEIKDIYAQRIDAFLKSVGATPVNAMGQALDTNSKEEWPDPGACQDG